MSNSDPQTWINWNAVIGLGFCLLALSIIFAASVGWYFARTLFLQQRSQRLQKARVLRMEILIQFRLIERHLTPGHQPMDQAGSELFEPLQAFWMQADLLEPEEMQAVHRACRILFSLRKRSSLNKKDVNMAVDLIHQTYQVLETWLDKNSASSVESHRVAMADMKRE